MNDLTVKFAYEAVMAGIPASIIAFDSWFAVPKTISRLTKEAKLTVIARLKTSTKQYYEYDGKSLNVGLCVGSMSILNFLFMNIYVIFTMNRIGDE